MDAIPQSNAATGTLETPARRLASIAQKYPEKLVTSRAYGRAYALKTLFTQCTELERYFPHFDSGQFSEIDLPLPTGAEGWFAIPRWDTVAATYEGAVLKVLECLAERYGRFLNHRIGELGPEFLRQSELKLTAFNKALMGGNVYFVPAQFGLRHRGRSARYVQERSQKNEFPLGSFEVSIMLLTHPERLARVEDLWITCAGDEYDLSESSDQSPLRSCLYFYCARGPLELGAQTNEEERERIGVPTGFLLS